VSAKESNMEHKVVNLPLRYWVIMLRPVPRAPLIWYWLWNGLYLIHEQHNKHKKKSKVSAPILALGPLAYRRVYRYVEV
jgi:hypothetical protein